MMGKRKAAPPISTPQQRRGEGTWCGAVLPFKHYSKISQRVVASFRVQLSVPANGHSGPELAKHHQPFGLRSRTAVRASSHWPPLRGSGLRSERSEQGAGLFGEIRPIQRCRNGFHMNDTLDAMTILSGPVKPEYSAPVIQHEQYAVAEIERIPEREKIVSMFGVAIAIRSRAAELL
jgi:hypothetical protein